MGCVEYTSVIDDQVLEVFYWVVKFEGIIFVLESVHVLVYAETIVGDMDRDGFVFVNLFGWGDKDVEIVQDRCSGGVSGDVAVGSTLEEKL